MLWKPSEFIFKENKFIFKDYNWLNLGTGVTQEIN